MTISRPQGKCINTFTYTQMVTYRGSQIDKKRRHDIKNRIIIN